MKRQIRIDGVVAYVPLSKGYEAVIDAADAHKISEWDWAAEVNRARDGAIRTVYAIRRIRIAGKQVRVAMHRVIAETPDGFDTDHINGDGLDNRRANLRSATRSQNSCNRRPQNNSASGVKGVTWHAARGKWQARIGKDGRSRALGYFASIEEAGAAYARASLDLHGEYGRFD